MNTSSAARPKPKHLPESTWAEIRTAHASGIGLRELARSMDIPAGTVLARAKRKGWTRRIESARTLARQAPSVDVGEAVAATMAERGQRHLQRVAGIVERTLPAVEAMAPEGVLDCIESFDRLDKVARRTFGLDEKGAGTVHVSIFNREQIVEISAIDMESVTDGE